MPNFSPCDLHIPNKQWSGDPLEEQNYLAIERWARYFHENCLGGSSCSCGATLEVVIDGDTYNENTNSPIEGAGTVDPRNYGYDGLAVDSSVVMEWDDINHLFHIVQPGLYSVNGYGRVISYSKTTPAGFTTFLGRTDRSDNTMYLRFCQDGASNAGQNNGGADDEIWLFPQVVYPMPAGSKWRWNFLNGFTGGSAFFILGFIVEKVNCCDLPPGPPPC